MHVFITGASGLAGHAITAAALERGFKVTAHSHSRDTPFSGGEVRHLRMDLANPENAVPLLLESFPDVIINAAAVSSPARAQEFPERAEKLNVALPRRLAQVANHLSARIIHLSSDMVFDGVAGPYATTAAPNPRSLYGQMKLLSEREVLKYGGVFSVVLRVPILTGDSPAGDRSLHEKLFNTWAEGKKTALFTDEIRQPLAVNSLAEAVVEICERPSLCGIFHWGGADTLSRHDMGLRIARHFGLPEHLIEPASCTGLKRPRDLRLSLAPLHPKLKAQPTDFNAQLQTMTPPALCRAWYASIRQKSADALPNPQRFVRGRDF